MTSRCDGLAERYADWKSPASVVASIVARQFSHVDEILRVHSSGRTRTLTLLRTSTWQAEVLAHSHLGWTVGQGCADQSPLVLR